MRITLWGIAAALVLGAGCGDDDSVADAGPVGDARPSGDGAPPDEDAAMTGCARFGFVASGDACGTCAPVQCECPDAFPRSLTECTPDGCLIAADCATVCAAVELTDALDCTDTYTVAVETCADDSECPGGFCDPEGVCRAWEPRWALAGESRSADFVGAVELGSSIVALTSDRSVRTFTGEALAAQSDVLTILDSAGSATGSAMLAERNSTQMAVRRHADGDLLFAATVAAGAERSVTLMRLAPDGGAVRWAETTTGGGAVMTDLSLSASGEALVALELTADTTFAERALTVTGEEAHALVAIDADGSGVWDIVAQGDASSSSAAYTGDGTVAWALNGTSLTLEGEALPSRGFVRVSAGTVLDRSALSQPALRVGGGPGGIIVLTGYSNNPVRTTDLLPGLELPIGRDTWVAVLDGTAPVFLTIVAQHGIDGDLDNLSPAALRMEGDHVMWAGTQRKPVTIPGIGRVEGMADDMVVARFHAATGALERFAAFGTPDDDAIIDADLSADGGAVFLGLARGPGTIGPLVLDQAELERSYVLGYFPP